MTSEATVNVNGIAAQVVNRSFLAQDVPLAPGANELLATAVDAAGNLRESSVSVTYETAPAARIRIVSGNLQSGVIGTPLPQPLVVELLDAAGQPVAGKPVFFRLAGNDGALDGGRRRLAIVSDAGGRAQCHFTLGGRAGIANQVVEASAAGFAGPAVFAASAQPGAPELIVVDSGGLQVGVAGRRVPRPLIAAVVDSGHNRLEGVPVLFEVAKGQGTFAGGSQSTVLATDSDGRAIVTFRLDPEEGVANNVVAARLEDSEDGPAATFVASGRAAGDPAATSISGVVLDNTSVPIEGVTARIKDTALTAVTDAEGQFRIDSAPVGSVKLIIDGSTADRPGSWPHLDFDLVTIPGRDNTVNMPIYLLPLDLASGLYVDETDGGSLTLPDVPGFALDVAPGSVTFPGGGRSGLVSVTVVHSDRVPMVPNFGQQPRLIVTIQPAGARFEPPARMTLPNVEGLAPGEVTEMYSFDHDLGHFVSIGPATVSDDGRVMRSDPGIGIVKAGWHCGGNPSGAGTPHACPQCQVCDGSTCVVGCPIPGSFTEPDQRRSQIGSTKVGCGGCDDGNLCTSFDDCDFLSGRCKGKEIEINSVDARANGGQQAVVAIQDDVEFSALAETTNCIETKYDWIFPDGTTVSGQTTGYSFSQKGIHTVLARVTCDGCSKFKSDAVTVVVVELENLQVIDGATQVNVIGSKNWAAVRDEGEIWLEASISPDVEGGEDLISWTGGDPVVGSNKIRVFSKSDFARELITARLGPDSREVQLWVLWATIEFRQSGSKSTNNNKTFPEGYGSGPTHELLGPLTDEDHGITLAEGTGKVEIKATVLPHGANEVVKESWEILRTVRWFDCNNGSKGPITFEDDTSDPDFTDLVPDDDGGIYDLDGPTIGKFFLIDHTKERYLNFAQWVEWNGEQASGFLEWHYQAQVDDDLDSQNKPRNDDTVLNDVAEGTILFPESCFFTVRP